MDVKLTHYQHNHTQLEAYAAIPQGKDVPLVVLCHAWAGRDAFIDAKARLLSSWGYVGFALDIYGKAVIGHSREQCVALKAPFLKDRRFLMQRLLAGYEAACALPSVDLKRIAVLGYGFGGLCALDLVRYGLPFRGTISVYGHYDPPPFPLKPIQAKVLILHGHRDRVSSIHELQEFQRELDQQGVDWQVHLFGKASHAFATPGAQDPEAGVVYDELSARRSDRCIQDFLKEIFV